MKKQYLKSIFLLGILCTVLSCGENARQADGLSDKTHIINIPEDLSNISHLDSVFSDITFIPLETREECLISYISTIKIADSLIYINNNRKQLLVFEKNGKFKYQIGNQGEGPGEYLEINDYIINKDNIELLDFKKILTYSLTGEYLETKNFDLLNDTVYCNAEGFCHSPLGGYYFWGGTSGIKNYNSEQIRYMMYHVDNNINITKGYFPIEHGTGTAHTRFKSYKDTIIIDPYLKEYNIYQIDDKGTLSSRYFFNFGKNAYTQKLPVGRNKGKHETYEDFSKYIISCEDFQETEKWLHISFAHENKAYSALLNKGTQKCYLLSAANPHLKTDELRFWGAYASWGEQLIMPIEASWLQIELARISPEYINKLNIGHYKSMDEFNNPILVLYKLKESI